MDRNITSKKVVITGASSGIGRSCVFNFAENGANVALVSKHGERERLEQIKKELNGLFPDIEALVRPTDVSVHDDVRDMVKDVVAQFKKVDILVNCAGVGMHGPIVETVAEDLYKLMAVNFYGYFHCIKEIYPYMKHNGGGQIINICSLVGYKAFPGVGVYSASKHTVKGLSDALRFELEKDNISVILVSPSNCDTEFNSHSFHEGKEEYIYDKKGMAPDYVAKEIVKAAAMNKREVILSREGQIVTTLNRLSPTLTDMLIKYTRKKAK